MLNMKASISWKQSRRLLQQEFSDDSSIEPTLSPQPILGSIKNTSTSASKKPFNPYSPFDSSMTFTLLILFTFLFFMGFFSVYIRRFSDQETTEARRRRNPSPPSRLVVKNKGLDSSTISALPLVSYRGSTKQGILEDCTICLSEFEEGEMVKLIPNCRHVFHPSCIDTWLESHVSCPLCRCTQLFKNVDEVWLDVDRSTAESVDTSAEVVGRSEIRRSCSGSNLGSRMMLHRSPSF